MLQFVWENENFSKRNTRWMIDQWWNVVKEALRPVVQKIRESCCEKNSRSDQSMRFNKQSDGLLNSTQMRWLPSFLTCFKEEKDCLSLKLLYLWLVLKQSCYSQILLLCRWWNKSSKQVTDVFTSFLATWFISEMKSCPDFWSTLSRVMQWYAGLTVSQSLCWLCPPLPPTLALMIVTPSGLLLSCRERHGADGDQDQHHLGAAGSELGRSVWIWLYSYSPFSHYIFLRCCI